MDLVNTLPDVRYTGTQLLKAIIYANAYYYGVCMRDWVCYISPNLHVVPLKGKYHIFALIKLHKDEFAKLPSAMTGRNFSSFE